MHVCVPSSTTSKSTKLTMYCGYWYLRSDVEEIIDDTCPEAIYWLKKRVKEMNEKYALLLFTVYCLIRLRTAGIGIYIGNKERERDYILRVLVFESIRSVPIP